MSNRKRIQDVITKMLLGNKWQFWGAVLAMLDVRLLTESDPLYSQIPTAALNVNSQKLEPEIIFNDTFASNISNENIAFILIHEAKHFIYMHPWLLHKGYNPQIANICADRYINTESIVDGYIVKKDFNIKDVCNKSLLRDIEGLEKIFYMEGNQTVESHDVERIYQETLSQHSNSSGFDKEGFEKKYGRMSGTPDMDEGGMPGGLLDNHDIWEHVADKIDEESAKQMVKTIAENASATCGAPIPVNVQILIDSFHQHTIPWGKHLKTWVARNVTHKKKGSWARPHRYLTNDLPGKQREREQSICFVMDVSGSISNEEFADFNSEALFIANKYQTYLIQVDGDVKEDMVKYNPKLIKNKGIHRLGCGGTDMNPGIKEAFEESSIDMVILFTDGVIPPLHVLDEMKNTKPLLIIITKGGQTLSKSKYYQQIQLT